MDGRIYPVERWDIQMAKFGPIVWSGHGLEVYVSPGRPTKGGGRKVWIRIQGAIGTQFRVYESLSYARSADVCFQEQPHPPLSPRKRRASGP